MTIHQGTPIWADLQSTDREAARAFYAELFGWEWEVGDEQVGGYANASIAGNAIAGEMGVPPGAPEMAMWSLYLASDDIAASAEAIEKLGGKTLVEPMKIDPLGAMGFFQDPTGAPFGLWQGGDHVGFAIDSAHGHPCWFEVNTRDSERARDFYASLSSDLEPSKMPNMQYYTLNAGGRPRFGVMQMTEEWGELPPHWMVYFASDDVDATAQRANDLGGEVHHGPFDTDFGRMVVLSDPQGAVFTAITPS